MAKEWILYARLKNLEKTSLNRSKSNSKMEIGKGDRMPHVVEVDEVPDYQLVEIRTREDSDKFICP